jgi:hypothetical protein
VSEPLFTLHSGERLETILRELTVASIIIIILVDIAGNDTNHTSVVGYLTGC